MSRISLALVVAVAVCGFAGVSAKAQDDTEIPPMVTLPDGSRTQKGAEFVDGRWQLPDGTPTYRVTKDGTVDWSSYSGFKRYHDVGGCVQCHGPEGRGSSYGPVLVDRLKTIPFSEFFTTVASGKRDVGASGGTTLTMPAMGDDKNVFCFINDIYTYLRGRSQGVIPRGRPQKRDPKPEEAAEYEEECFG